MKLTYLLIWGCKLVFGSSAVWALAVAIRKRGDVRFQSGAESIFDEEEPVGRPTDAFPGARP